MRFVKSGEGVNTNVEQSESISRNGFCFSISKLTIKPPEE